MMQNFNYMNSYQNSFLRKEYLSVDLPYWQFHLPEGRQYKSRIAILVLILTK